MADDLELFDTLLDALSGIFLAVEPVSDCVLSVYHNGIELEVSLDGMSVTVSGDTPHERLPHKFSFRSEPLVLPVLVPFLMQCFDGLRRL